MRRAHLAVLLALALPVGAAAELVPAAATALRPGTFLWNDTGGPGTVSVIVNRRKQVAAVYRGETLIALAAVSTGKPGHGTPAGEFTILEKAVHHRSNIYSNAPMPFMQRLTWGGIAIHAGHNPGFPASHGCIRVPIAFARKLFATTRIGSNVRIGDEDVPGTWLEMDTTAPPPPASYLEQSQEDYVSWGGAWRR